MFENFLTHEEPSVQAAAELLEQAGAAYERGELSRDEFEELAEDTLQIDRVDELADTLERKIQIQQAFQAMIAIIGAIPK